jgi:hypothetical protein
LKFLGPILNLDPQQGQNNPSHFINKSHIWQRLFPVAYRLGALCCIQIPLHAILLLLCYLLYLTLYQFVLLTLVDHVNPDLVDTTIENSFICD